MTREEFRQLASKRKLILDGATGTNLQKRGMPEGVCPEKWITENPDVIKDLQKEYISAGSDILYASTFSGNRIKLEEYGLQDQLEFINTRLVEISKEAVRESGTSKKIFIAGDLTMTGKQVYPLGDLPFEELYSVYKEQAEVLYRAGVDLFVVETMMSLQECRAALLAIKDVCDLPVMVTMTFNEDGRALFGTEPGTAALVLNSMHADAIGVNCSTGPDKMAEVVKRMAMFTDAPIVAKPNAGMPELINGETVYPLGPDEFAREMQPVIDAGADIIGGCCGSDARHIRKLTESLGNEKWKPAFPERKGHVIRRALSTERNTLPIDLDGRFLIIGERINPTGKKKLAQSLREGSTDLVMEMAEAEAENGADILDVNMGANGVDEYEMMEKCVNELTMAVDLPLCLDSSDPGVIEKALRIYPGRALINSISLEEGKCETLLPAAYKYGAMFICLPLSGAGLPKDVEERKQHINTIIGRAEESGLTKDDVVVDGLVATIGAQPDAAKDMLATVDYCKNHLHVATACGLSNISFGLPDRMFVNSSFMSMAILSGLTMAIANPDQELLMHAVAAADILMHKPGSDLNYISRVNEHKISIVEGDVTDEQKKGLGTSKGGSGKGGDVIPEEYAGDELYAAVVRGKKDRCRSIIRERLEDPETDPQALLNEHLIPAINQVGVLYDKQIYYLPQLISAAEAMSAGVALVEPHLGSAEHTESPGTVVIATVEHDIHDIGKNLVALMLKNYGFKVIDLGKDVPSEEIVDVAEKEDADIIGLSALMTTTMMEMKKVVELSHKRGLRAKIMIGGAAITQGFADEIGADGYSEDAQAAVELAKKMVSAK